MAYEKKTWETGEVITADGLNHIEDGVQEALASGGSDVLVTHITTDITASTEQIDGDMTYTEIDEALLAGKVVFLQVTYEMGGDVFGITPLLIIKTTSNVYASEGDSGNNYQLNPLNGNTWNKYPN